MDEVLTNVVEGRTIYQVVRKRGLRGQQFHVRIKDVNGHILLSSEKYRNYTDAEKVLRRFLPE